jgi:hypothetical protein
MIMLLLKIIICPIVLFLADLMMVDVFFPSTWAIIWTGLALALLGLAMEAFMLRRGTLWLTTVADWAVGAAIVFLSPYVFAGGFVSIVGALLTGGLLAIPEYFMHRYAIASATRARY